MPQPAAPSRKPQPAAPLRKLPANSPFHRPMTPSAELAAVIGPGTVSRAEATSRLWGSIENNGCQDPKNKREIVADTKLRQIFGSARATMFEIPKHLNRHLT